MERKNTINKVFDIEKKRNNIAIFRYIYFLGTVKNKA